MRPGRGDGELSEYVDVEPVAEPVGLAVLLPGRAFSPARPLLDFATQACVEAGWWVRQVWWDPPDGHPAARPDGDPAGKVAWVEDELLAALDGTAGRVLVLGKSLGTFAAPHAARHSLDAIWLTPVLTEALVVEAVRANRARQLLVGGTEDPYWRPDVTLPTTAESLSIAGADHSMTHVDGVLATVGSHLEVMAGLQAWVAATTTGGPCELGS
jgi:hypothetical protein